MMKYDQSLSANFKNSAEQCEVMPGGYNVFQLSKHIGNLIRLGKLDLAKEALLPIINTTNSPVLLFQAAQIASKRGYPQKAIEFLERSLSASPKDVRSLQLIGDCLTELGRFSTAAVFFKRTLESELKNPQGNPVFILARLCKVYMKIDLPQAALEAADKMIVLDRKNVIGWHFKKTALEFLGRHQEAEEAAREESRLDSLQHSPRQRPDAGMQNLSLGA